MIVTDVLLPNSSAHDVCAQLKRHASTRNTPVIAYAGAYHSVPAERAPTETNPVLEHDCLQVAEGLMLVCLNCLIVRNVRIVIQRCEGIDQARKAIILANRIRVPIGANRCSQPQVRFDCPLILEINAQAVDGQRISRKFGKVLAVPVADVAPLPFAGVNSPLAKSVRFEKPTVP